MRRIVIDVEQAEYHLRVKLSEHTADHKCDELWARGGCTSRQARGGKGKP